MNRRGLWLAIFAVAIAGVLVLLFRRDAPPVAVAPPPPAAPVPAAAPAPPPAAPEPPPVVPVPEFPTAAPEVPAAAAEEPVDAHRLRCLVRREDGTPIEGARVAIDFEEGRFHGPDGLPLAAELVDAARSGRTEGTTDAEGRCALEARLPQRTTIPLVASAPDFVARRKSIVAVDWHGMVPVVVILELRRAGVLHGRVIDQERAPVAGATVAARSIQGDLESSSVATGPDGSFRIADAPEGECRVRAFSTAAPPRGQWMPDGAAAFARTGTLNLELTLPWTEPRGAAVRVEVVDASGTPVAVKQAVLTPLDRWYREIPRRTTGRPRLGDGFVSLDAVGEGRWRVWMETVGHGVRYADVVVAPGDTSVQSRIETRPLGSLRGRVMPGDAPRPGRSGYQLWLELHGNGYFPQFTIVDPEKPNSLGRKEQPTRMASADGEGNFRIADLLPGRYRLAILNDGVSAVADVEVRSGAESTVDLTATRSATVTFRIPRPEWGRQYCLSCWEDGGIRKPGRVLEPTGEGTVVVEKEVHPGRVYWGVEWTEWPGRERDGLRIVAVGHFEIAPGANETIDVASGDPSQPQTPR